MAWHGMLLFLPWAAAAAAAAAAPAAAVPAVVATKDKREHFAPARRCCLTSRRRHRWPMTRSGLGRVTERQIWHMPFLPQVPEVSYSTLYLCVCVYRIFIILTPRTVLLVSTLYLVRTSNTSNTSNT
jgi:hypothetical protein